MKRLGLWLLRGLGLWRPKPRTRFQCLILAHLEEVNGPPDHGAHSARRDQVERYATETRQARGLLSDGD